MVSTHKPAVQPSAPSSYALDLEAAAAGFIARKPSEAHLIAKGLAVAKEPGRVAATETAGIFSVIGSKGDAYTVRAGRCSCEARKRCYHRWALAILNDAGHLPTYRAPLRRSEIETLRIVLTPELAAAGAALAALPAAPAPAEPQTDFLTWALAA
jgi:hypothetical protein